MTKDPRSSQQIDQLMVALEKACAGLSNSVVLVALSNIAAARIAATDPHDQKGQLDAVDDITRAKVAKLQEVPAP